ncbi:MAG TPA: hypothetical protein VF885_15230 [Arthrobacter sp.]
MTAQTEAQASTITTLTDALRPTSTYSVDSPEIPGAVVLTLENEESRKTAGSSIYATVGPDGELAKVELARTVEAGGSAVTIEDMTEDHLGHNVRALVLRAQRLTAPDSRVRVESPVVISDVELTFEQSVSVEALIEALAPTVAIIAVSPTSPGAVVVRYGRAAAGEHKGSTVFVVLDARGELVSVTLGTPGERREEFVESDETNGELGVNLRAVLVRARHA